MAETIFDKIVSGDLPSWPIWEDDKHLAFLTPFPNTPGATVVIPKTNPGDYIFDLEASAQAELLTAATTVAKLLEKALDTPRVAMVFEGTGVAHVHAKLYPLHGTLGAQTEVGSSHTEFYPTYVGYLTTVEGAKMPDADLAALQAKITAVSAS
ncbi:HIT family protein [Candidatus Saccharibacteria bacterium]|nr:HIT family protein [Candidatus Saccharibacteria bacterium]